MLQRAAGCRAVAAVRGILCAVLLVTGVSAAAGSPTASRQATAAELVQLRQRIHALERELGSVQGRHSAVEVQLRNVERALGGLAQRRQALNTKLAGRRRRLAQLQRRRLALTDALATQRGALAQQVRAAYAMGRQPRLKLFLNQQDPEELGRLAVYFDYLNRARSQEIEAVGQRLQQLSVVRAQIEAQVVQLDRLREEQLAQQQAFEQRRATRAAVLARLGGEIQSKNDELKRLQRNETRLQGLLRHLQDAMAGIPAGPSPGQPFGRLKGRLTWPTQGRIAARFGTPRLSSALKWRGVLIDAPPGQPVRAVSYGRVVFADWLRGFGLLMIIDHGDGYMSLYGHNQTLDKRAGDWVEPGEVIATVGDSGGEKHAGLYFEIRHNGHPVDPAAWCRSGPPRHVGMNR